MLFLSSVLVWGRSEEEILDAGNLHQPAFYRDATATIAYGEGVRTLKRPKGKRPCGQGHFNVLPRTDHITYAEQKTFEAGI